MPIQKFEDIIACQKAKDLAKEIYLVFGPIKDFGFRDQITRAAISISNNIAEGFDRGSNADFCRFLYFSLGSCSEVRSMLYIAEELGYISLEKRDLLIEQSSEISKVLNGFIKSISKKP